MLNCRLCGGAIRAPRGKLERIEYLREANQHRAGKYAEAYRLGLSVASGEITPAIDVSALGQGYRDGLKLRDYRVPVKGAGSKSRNAERIAKRRKKNRAAEYEPTRLFEPGHM